MKLSHSIYKSRRDEATGQEALVPVPPRAHCGIKRLQSAHSPLRRHRLDNTISIGSVLDRFQTVSMYIIS